MIAMTSTETKEKWGEVVRIAQREVIRVESHGKPTVYVISANEYEQIKLLALRNKLAKSALQADKGLFSTATAEDIIRMAKKVSSEQKNDL